MLRLQGKSQKFLTESLVSYKIKKKKNQTFPLQHWKQRENQTSQKITYKAVKNGKNKTNFRAHKNLEYIALRKLPEKKDTSQKKQDSEAENAGQVKRNGGNIHVCR